MTVTSPSALRHTRTPPAPTYAAGATNGTPSSSTPYTAVERLTAPQPYCAYLATRTPDLPTHRVLTTPSRVTSPLLLPSPFSHPPTSPQPNHLSSPLPPFLLPRRPPPPPPSPGTVHSPPGGCAQISPFDSTQTQYSGNTPPGLQQTSEMWMKHQGLAAKL